MYIFLIGKDNYITTTKSERIIQRSKLANTICIRVANYYNGISMKDCQAIMRYHLPISDEWKPRELIASEELYKEDYVEYLIPVDTWLTSEPGDVEFEIKFYNGSMDGEVNISQFLRRATHGKIHISCSKDWESGISDPLLGAIDDRIIELIMLQKKQEETINEAQIMVNGKADSIAKDDTTNEIYLTSNGVEIGKRIKDECDIEGVPVVDLNSTTNIDSSGNESDVLEF